MEDIDCKDIESVYVKYLSTLTIESIHEELFKFLDYKGFNLYKFFSLSDLKLSRDFNEKYKDSLATSIFEQFFLPNEPNRPMDDEERKNIYYYLSIVEKYYPSYIKYFDNLFQDFKKGLFPQSDKIPEVVPKSNVADFDTSIKSKAFLNLFIPPPHTEEAIAAYINDWITYKVTLNQWLLFNSVDIKVEFSHLDICEEQQEEISQHQCTLFNKLKNQLFENGYKRKFEFINTYTSKIEIANRDLSLINDLINGNIDSFKADRLKIVFNIENWGKIALQCEYILRDRYVNDESYNIHSKDNFLNSEVLIMYRDFLINFIENDNAKNAVFINTIVNNPVNNTFTNFHKSFLDFIDSINTGNFFSRDCSCYNLYDFPKPHLKKLEAEILLLYTTIPASEKENFINAYLKYISNTADKNISSYRLADEFLIKNNITLTELFEENVFSHNPESYVFPSILKYSFKNLSEFMYDDESLNLNHAFLAKVSNFYLQKLTSFFKGLLSNNSIKESVKEIEIKNVAFTLTDFKLKKENVSDLFDSLFLLKFISDKKNSKKDFYNIFNNKKPSTPITWFGSISELYYFVKYIHIELCVIKKLGKDIWKVTSKIFIYPDNSHFDWKKFRSQKTPASALNIEKAAKHLLS